MFYLNVCCDNQYTVYMYVDKAYNFQWNIDLYVAEWVKH